MSSLEINYKKVNSNTTVYEIYIPSQIDINLFLDEFKQTILHRARAKKSNYTIIKGDINGFISIVNCITRTKEIGGSCLDHVLLKSNTLTYVKTFIVQKYGQ